MGEGERGERDQGKSKTTQGPGSFVHQCFPRCFAWLLEDLRASQAGQPAGRNLLPGWMLAGCWLDSPLCRLRGMSHESSPSLIPPAFHTMPFLSP